MTLSLSSTDIARLGTAAEALLSAPADPDPWTWWRKTEDRVRPLFPGANVMLSAADTGRLRNESATVDPTARQRMADLGAADPRTGAFIVHDPVIEAWIAYRRRHRMELWSTAGWISLNGVWSGPEIFRCLF